VDAVALRGCLTPNDALLISIQPTWLESADSPFIPSMSRYASTAMSFSIQVVQQTILVQSIGVALAGVTNSSEAAQSNIIRVGNLR
jgi:hypothetical protein